MTTVLIVLGVLALFVVVASLLTGRAGGDRAVPDAGEQRATERREESPPQSTRVLGDPDERVGGESGGRFRRNGHGDLHASQDVEAGRER